MKPKFADRFIDSIEFLAALFGGIVAADVFVSVLLRYFFGVSIPDSYDFGRLLLGVLIFWGIGRPPIAAPTSPSISSTPMSAPNTGARSTCSQPSSSCS